MSHKNHHTGWLSPFVDSLRLKRIARQVVPDDRVLDIGCGPGHLQKFLPAVYYTGIDNDTESTTAYPVLKLDATKKIPLESGRFDVIVMASFLEHIENPVQLFPELERLLKQTGIIVATTPTPLGGKVHEILAKLGMLSLDAAHDHTHGFLTKKDFYAMTLHTRLYIWSYKQFQFGLNQIVVWKKAP